MESSKISKRVSKSKKPKIMKKKNISKDRKKIKRNKTVSKRKRPVKKRGSGLINSVIDKLPFEMHLPGYRYCGPGTKLEERLKRGDAGINQLDEACKIHDIAYASNNSKIKRMADQDLRSKAWQRIKAKDSSFGEKSAALTVAGLMKLKSGVEKIGAGLNSGGNSSYEGVLGDAIHGASSSLKKTGHKSEKEAAKIALHAARAVVKRNKNPKKSWNKYCKYRVISIPKTGGALPLLIPLFAGLSAVGSLAGGTAAVVNAVNSTKNARAQLKESERHNQIMEAIAIGNKRGSGLHLKPYRKGLGLYLNPQLKPKNY